MTPFRNILGRTVVCTKRRANHQAPQPIANQPLAINSVTISFHGLVLNYPVSQSRNRSDRFGASAASGEIR